jgi:hypothetical protein
MMHICIIHPDRWQGRSQRGGRQPGLQPPYRPWEHTTPLSPAYRHEEKEEGKEGREEEEEEAALAPVWSWLRPCSQVGFWLGNSSWCWFVMRETLLNKRWQAQANRVIIYMSTCLVGIINYGLVSQSCFFQYRIVILEQFFFSKSPPNYALKCLFFFGTCSQCLRP